jgi:hypothetical protein
MSNLDDKLNKILGVPTTTSSTPPAKVPRVEDKNKEDIDNDYKYSRENYYNLIERGTDAIDGILEIAKEGQHPRAYEVAGNLIKQVAETVDKLEDLQGKIKRLKDVPNKAPSIKNALFIGSSAELHKLLKDKPKKTEPKKEDLKTVSEQSQDDLEPIITKINTSPMSDE